MTGTADEGNAYQGNMLPGSAGRGLATWGEACPRRTYKARGGQPRGKKQAVRASTGEPHTVSFGHPQSNPLQWQSFQFRITELTSTGQDFCLRCDPMSCSPTQRSTCHNSSEQTCVTFRDQVSVSLSPLPLPNTHIPDTPPALN